MSLLYSIGRKPETWCVSENLRVGPALEKGVKSKFLSHAASILSITDSPEQRRFVFQLFLVSRVAVGVSPKPFSATVSSSAKWREKSSSLVDGSMQAPVSCAVERSVRPAAEGFPVSAVLLCEAGCWQDGERPC